MAERRDSYFRRLRERLRLGLCGLPAPVRDRHAAFVLAQQRADGGFAGRQGGSDLYYTAFAVRALAVLDRLDADAAERVARFLDGVEPTTVVDLLSWLSTAEEVEAVPRGRRSLVQHWGPPVVETMLEDRRATDGGYGLAPEGVHGSVYQTFLAVLCYNVVGRPVPDREQVGIFLASHQCVDGGYAEHVRSRHGSTNATAAGVALSALFDGSPFAMDDAVAFLVGMQTAEGGWSATRRAPVADLLSTFTAMLTLADLGALDEADLEAAEAFVRGGERPDGGFGAGPFDEGADVEYTYYGLGCTALLAAARC